MIQSLCSTLNHQNVRVSLTLLQVWIDGWLASLSNQFVCAISGTVESGHLQPEPGYFKYSFVHFQPKTVFVSKHVTDCKTELHLKKPQANMTEPWVFLVARNVPVLP